MADTTALYLTKEEIDNLFAKLPVMLQKAWRKFLREETLDTYETKEGLDERMNRPWRDESKELKAFVKHVRDIIDEGKGPDAINLNNFPDTAFPHYFYSIGACGMSALIEIALQSKVKSSDMRAIAGLTFIRHVILQANSLATAKS